MKISKELRAVFEAGEPRYTRLAAEIRDSLKPDVEGQGWFFTSRVKRLESFALKIETGRAPDPANLEDFFACTIVVPTIPEIAVAERFVLDRYLCQTRRPPEDLKTKKNSSTFSFDDLRLYVYRDALPSGRNTDLDGVVFEIQIKTILQHAWSIATHDLIYKSETVSWPRERIAYQVKAMLEHAEIAIAEANNLAVSPAFAKHDERTLSVGTILETLQAKWAADRLPADVKRLADTVYDLLRTCQMEPCQLAGLIEEEMARVGALPGDMSPYSFIVQALAQAPGLNFKKLLERGRMMVVTNSSMDLPVWMLEDHQKLIRMGAPPQSLAAAETANAGGAGGPG